MQVENKANISNKSLESRRNHTKAAHKAKKATAVTENQANVSDFKDEDEELCLICTEAITTYAIAQCNHRTCDRCSLRLRALYKVRNCAYCKAEQELVIFSKDGIKLFEDYSQEDTPFTDKKLNIRFETKEMYNDTMHTLGFNCPQEGCNEQSFHNWGELKQHVRKAHSLNICDVCSQHKKVFPFEHILYTAAQLNVHQKEGDKKFNENDETGFTGHPDCAFCRTRFFGDDELLVHCRDQHEQCYICNRNGRRYEYYANYQSLEDHFQSEHYMCPYPQCLEKKFVVFDSAIDLKSHEVKDHGESTAGLQRSMQTESRRLELNFQYESFRSNQHNGSRRGEGSNSRRDGNKKEDTKKGIKNNASSSSTASNASSSTATLSNTNEFPSISASSSKTTAAAPSQPRHVPGSSGKKGKAMQKPAGFGALSSTAVNLSVNDSGRATSVEGRSSSNSPAIDMGPNIVASHTAFLSKVENILKTKEKVSEFRTLTGAYRKNNLACEKYVDSIVHLANNRIEDANKVLKGVENLLDIEEKKTELVRVWRNKQTTMSQFPALESKERPIIKSSRVLVIKSPKPVGRPVVGARGNKKQGNVWDKVASAATAATTVVSNSPSSSAQTSARASPQNSRPASPSNTFRTPSKTPWSGSSGTNTPNSNGSSKSTTANDFPSLKPKAFPALPTSARSKNHELILSMRKSSSEQNSNAWNNTNSESGESGEDLSSTTDNKKKKGRKNNVLFRVGL